MTRNDGSPVASLGLVAIFGVFIFAMMSQMSGSGLAKLANEIARAMPEANASAPIAVWQPAEVEVQGVALSAAQVQSEIYQGFLGNQDSEVELSGFEGFEVFLYGESDLLVTGSNRQGFEDVAQAAFVNQQVRSVTVVTPDGQVVRLPDFDEEQLAHAAASRGSILKVMLVYELLQFQPLGMYCGTASLTCIVHANDRQLGDVIGVFINGGSSTVPQLLRPVSVIFSSRGVNLVTVRASSCASWKVFPNLEFHAQYEPPPTGVGTCLENGNVHTP